MNKSERGLKITAYIISFIFVLLILFPLFYIINNSLKDNVKVYEVPPKLIPDSAKSLSISVDYSDFKNKSKEELLDIIQKDSVLAMYSSIYELDKSSIFEIKYYGRIDNKTIYYSRSHKLGLQLEMDFGVYAQSAVKKDVLLYGDRYKTASDSAKYVFNLEGLDRKIDTGGKETYSQAIRDFLPNKYGLSGRIDKSLVKTNNLLMVESYKYYFNLPSYVYKTNEVIKRFSFLAFILNTCIVIGWAIISQTLLGSLTAFGISRLLGKKAANLILLYFLATLMIPFVSVMIPQFVMFKQMGLYNNYAALLVPFLYPFGFYIYLFKGFFDRLPNSLFEAARIDGASNLFCYLKICIPLSKPIISLIALQTFLGNWNDFFWAWMVTEKQSLWTLNVALYQLSRNQAVKQNFIMGLSVVTIIPVVLLTVFFSNQIKESIASSGIKG